MPVYTSLAVFLFSAIALTVPSGFSVGAAMLLLGGLITLGRPPRSMLSRDDRAVILTLAFYFAVTCLMNLVHRAPLREFDAPLRFLLAIPALLLLLKYPPRPAALWGGLIVGAAGAGLYAGWQSVMQGIVRADGDTNPIQYGNISMVLGVLCIAGIPWARQRQRAGFWMALLAIGAALGSFGSILSESRGSWVALPLALGILAFAYGKTVRPQQLLAGGIAFAILCGTTYAIPETGVKQRVADAVTEAHGYFERHKTSSEKAATPVGARLEMWRMGWMMFPEHPWLGWGKIGYMQHAKVLAQEGKVNPVVTEHSHLHNEYIDALVKRGIPGLLATLALYLAPLLLFARHFREGTAAARPYALAGMMLVVSYLGFGLTQAFLTHNNGVMIYAFMLAILWSQMRSSEAGKSAGYADT